MVSIVSHDGLYSIDHVTPFESPWDGEARSSETCVGTECF